MRRDSATASNGIRRPCLSRPPTESRTFGPQRICHSATRSCNSPMRSVPRRWRRRWTTTVSPGRRSTPTRKGSSIFAARPPAALLALGRYDEALPAIDEAMAIPPPVDEAQLLYLLELARSALVGAHRRCRMAGEIGLVVRTDFASAVRAKVRRNQPLPAPGALLHVSPTGGGRPRGKPGTRDRAWNGRSCRMAEVGRRVSMGSGEA